MLKNFTSLFRHKILLSFLLLTGCSGWRISDSIGHSKAVRIPYVEGDSTGNLTSALVEAINAQPGFHVDEYGQYQLKVKILDKKEEKIGFRYDPTKDKKGHHDLIKNENRALTLALVTIIDTHTNKTLLGPAHILGSIDYDHQENSLNNDIINFSLGQLSDIDTINDMKHIPIHKDLAHKISTWLQNELDIQST